MAAKYKEYGGGSATGLADQFTQFLSQGLNTGTFGAGTPAGGDAMNSTTGIAGVLNDILSGGAGNLGGSLGQLIKNDTNDQVNQLRARYGAGGGTAYGTGAQYGEGVLRSKQAPALTSAIGNLQMNAVQQLLGQIAGISSKGIAQRQGVMEENPWMTAGKIAAGGAAAAAGMMTGVPGASAAGAGAGFSLGAAPGIFQTPGQGAPGVVNPGMISNVPMANNWTPTLFDYGLR